MILFIIDVCYAVLSHVMSCHVMSCHVMSCHFVLCCVMPFCVMPCHAIRLDTSYCVEYLCLFHTVLYSTYFTI